VKTEVCSSYNLKISAKAGNKHVPSDWQGKNGKNTIQG